LFRVEALVVHARQTIRGKCRLIIDSAKPVTSGESLSNGLDSVEVNRRTAK
jgi:hypothetical protein